MTESCYVSSYGRPRPKGAPGILFVHGAGMDHTVWALQGRHFAFHGWNALAVDLPGHGRSRALPPLASIEAMADALADLAGPEGAVLVGHSMGGLAALAAAARRPERVRALCLVGCAARMPVHPELLALAAAGDPKTVELMCDWAFGPRGQIGGSPSPGQWLQGAARSLLHNGDPAVLAGDLAACDAYTSGPEHAAAVRCPALVVIGALDRMTPPKAGRELAGLIPGARTAVIEGTGHMMMLETPDATLEALRGLLR
ncbi:alpha/beta fold hydrolase [Benzoatithermus flavus]|uniref:Alpha/beta hydrolase n=1 Tax=Benzoatithermus flavus TaxID=3108223 RepID=A0ABU8XQE1_9PROT